MRPSGQGLSLGLGVPVRDENAVVAHVAPAIAIRVVLKGVRLGRTVVADVSSEVGVGVRLVREPAGGSPRTSAWPDMGPDWRERQYRSLHSPEVFSFHLHLLLDKVAAFV